MLELGPAQPHLRSRHRARRPPSGSPRRRGRDAHDARRRRAHPHRNRRRHRRRGRRADRPRRGDGRCRPPRSRESTTDVLLEMAWWDPPSISRTVKRLNLPSEASTRFRRGADWGDNIDRAMRPLHPARRRVRVRSPSTGQIDVAGRPARSARRSGCEPARSTASRDRRSPPTEMAGHLTSIGFGAAPVDGDDLDVDDPDLAVGHRDRDRRGRRGRPDVRLREHRAHGAEGRGGRRTQRVPAGAGASSVTCWSAPAATRRCRCRSSHRATSRAAGLPEDGVTLTNPLVHEESVLRTSLLPGQLKAIAYNQSHRNDDVRFFEIDHVYLPSPEGQLLPDEREYLAVALAGRGGTRRRRGARPSRTGPRAAQRAAEAGDHRPVCTRPARPRSSSRGGPAATSARSTRLCSRTTASTGASRGSSSISVQLLDGPHGNRKYTPVSKYPSSDIDLAFEVPDDVAAGAGRRFAPQGRGRPPARGRAVRRLSGRGRRRRRAQPRLSPAVPGARPHAHRRRGRRGPPVVHRHRRQAAGRTLRG